MFKAHLEDLSCQRTRIGSLFDQVGSWLFRPKPVIMSRTSEKLHKGAYLQSRGTELAGTIVCKQSTSLFL